MKKVVLTMAVCVLAIGLVGCGKVPTLKNGEEVVASVKGKKISVEDLYTELKAKGGSTILVNMIDEYILNKEVETDEDAETYAESQLESYKSSYESYGQDFKEALEQAGYKNEDAFKEDLILDYKKQVIAENYTKEQITDAEIEKYYEESIFGDIEARHILIAPDVTDDMSDEDKTKAENKAKEEAEKIIKQLDKDGDFAKLAKEKSDDEGTAKNGGKLTLTYGKVVDEVWNAAKDLKNKTYTKEPVKSEYGYHIIYRISQKDKPKLKTVRDDIIDTLVDEKLQSDTTLQTQALVELRKKYGFKINDNDIDKAYNDSVKTALAKENS